jgi:ATP-dependent DNA helicase Rep
VADLNPEQWQAVRTTDRPLLVLAGAGSGKTRVITEKIAYLIEQRGLAPRHIVAITFTNKAAREMRERVAQRLTRAQTRGLRVSTFHTFGLGFLRSETAAAGLRPGFSLLDPGDCQQLLREITHRDADSPELESALAAISRWKNQLLNPHAALEQAVSADTGSPEARMAAHLYARYEDALRAYNAVDFDDLILRPVACLARDPQMRERWQEQIRHLLVDEYQDTNDAQYQLVRWLVGARQGLTVVGDDDQAIYTWRGARPENLARLPQDFPRLAVVKLEQNYRSTHRILAAANALIEQNPHLYPKQLWSALGEGERIQVVACPDADSEASRVIAEILRYRFRYRSAWNDFAILYRSNHQSRLLEKQLREQGIAYRISGGESFFDKAEIKDLVAYLRLLANPDDNTALLRIINVPRREIGAATLEKLGQFAQLRGVSLLRAARGAGLGEYMEPKARARLDRFVEWIDQYRRVASTTRPDGLLRSLVDDLDYETWLLDNSPNPRAASRRMENVQEFVQWIGRMGSPDRVGEDLATEDFPEITGQEGLSWAEANPTQPGGASAASPESAGTATGMTDLSAIVARIRLLDILEHQRDAAEEDAIQLMTLHSAKGLEFRHVFLVGFEEELLPHRVSLEDGHLEEERRLAYVGLTRARETLMLSYVQKRSRFGEDIEVEPSRFLEELPAAHLVWPDAQPPDREAEHVAGRARLAELRAMLERSTHCSGG